MSPALSRRLSRLALRLRVRRAFDGASAGLVAGLAAAVALQLIGKFVSLPDSAAILAGAVAAGLLLGAVAGFRRRVPLRTAAIWADRGAASDDVIATACESSGQDPFCETNRVRAEEVLRTHSDRRLLPRHRIRLHLTAIPFAAALLALAFVPRLAGSATEGDAPAAISPAVLRALEKSARQIARAGDQGEGRELLRLGQEMQRLAEAAKLGQISKKEALARVASLTERADKLRRDLAERREALARLAKNPATKSLAEAAARGDSAALQDRARDLARRLESGSLPAENLKDLKNALESIAKEGRGNLSKMAGEAGEALDRADREGFASRMGKLAEGLKGNSTGQKGESELAEALEDLGAAEDDLVDDELAKALEEGRCPDCGKDLGEGG